MNKTISKHRSLFIRAGAATLALSLATLCLAQQASPPPTTRFAVTVTQVKPDMLNEYLDLQKSEVNPALKKAGVASRAVSSTQFGNTYEYVSIVPLESYAQFDAPSPVARALGPEASARLGAKLRKCITSSRTYIATRADDLSIIPSPKDPPLVASTLRRRIAPGKGQEYRNFIRNEVLPVMKKAKAEGKIAGYSVATRGMGSNIGDITTTTFYNKFADMEGGNIMARMLGAEAAQKVAAKAAGLSTVVESYVRRRNADLSF